jgi:hypothetical protein
VEALAVASTNVGRPARRRRELADELLIVDQSQPGLPSSGLTLRSSDLQNVKAIGCKFLVKRDQPYFCPLSAAPLKNQSEAHVTLDLSVVEIGISN